jgi:hypothetical protein
MATGSSRIATGTPPVTPMPRTGPGYYGYAPSSYNYGYSGYSSGYTPGYSGYGVRRVARGVARRAYYRR